MYRQQVRWIYRLLEAVMAGAFEALKDLDSDDALRRQDARAALAWIMADDCDHPLTYLEACDELGLCPKYGRRFARRIKKRTRFYKPTENYYGNNRRVNDGFQ